MAAANTPARFPNGRAPQRYAAITVPALMAMVTSRPSSTAISAGTDPWRSIRPSQSSSSSGLYAASGRSSGTAGTDRTNRVRNAATARQGRRRASAASGGQMLCGRPHQTAVRFSASDPMTT